MRQDAFGLFWHDEVTSIRGSRETGNRPLAPIPETGWEPPTEYPNLFHARVLGIDTETKDLRLKTHGPGWARNDGHMVGFSLATEDGHAWYFPIRHTVQPELNLPVEPTLRYLKDLMACQMPKVGANILYDLGYMHQEGITVNGYLHDILYAEPILYDTAKEYSLESCARRWLGESKVDDALYKWCAKSYGGKIERKQAGNIWRAPPSLVGPYAEGDASLPLRIFERQYPQLTQQNLLDVYDLECRLIRVLLGMRLRGLPVDPERSEQVGLILDGKRDIAQEELNKAAGFDVEIYAADSLARLFDLHNLPYPKTPNGAPSFRKEWLAAQDNPIADLVNDARKYTKAGTFVRSSILEKQVDGKLYPNFHPLRSDDGGAVSGRYSCSYPNAQQVTARDPELAPLIRSCFIPEFGYPSWIKQDLSQIEYRFFAHFSGDERLIQEYQKKDTDYHEVVSSFLGHMMPRKPVKNFNFMSLYGGGKGKVVKMLKAEFTRMEADELLLDLTGTIPGGDPFSKLADVFIEMYQTNFPAAKDSLERDMDIAESYGEIRTIIGRRSTFDMWESSLHRRGAAYPTRERAQQEYGIYIKRAFCFRALNRRLQGSSADLLKKGMLDAYEQGVFDQIGFPHITVHDELDNSYHPDLQNGFYRLQQCIENAIPLRVPVLLGAEIGPDWGSVQEIELHATH